jgi:hypothetical protein
VSRREDDGWADIIAETLDEELAAEIEAARQPTPKRRISEAEHRQKTRAALSRAAALTPEDRREIGRQLAEGRRLAADRRRAAKEAAGEVVKERPSSRKDPSTRVLEPYIEAIYAEFPDANLSPLEARRMAITRYRLARQEALGK